VFRVVSHWIDYQLSIRWRIYGPSNLHMWSRANCLPQASPLDSSLITSGLDPLLPLERPYSTAFSTIFSWSFQKQRTIVCRKRVLCRSIADRWYIQEPINLMEVHIYCFIWARAKYKKKCPRRRICEIFTSLFQGWSVRCHMLAWLFFGFKFCSGTIGISPYIWRSQLYQNQSVLYDQISITLWSA